MEVLHQYRGSLVSLRGFHATPHVIGHPALYRQKGCIRSDTVLQRAYTAQLAATDLDPYMVSRDSIRTQQRQAYMFWRNEVHLLHHACERA